MATKNQQQPPLGEKLLFDKQDLQVLTGLSRSTINSLLRNGTIPSFRIGKCVRVKRTVFEQWIDQQHSVAQQQADRLAETRETVARKLSR